MTTSHDARDARDAHDAHDARDAHAARPAPAAGRGAPTTPFEGTPPPAAARRLDGAHVVVFGGSTGIGFAVARLAAAEGAAVTITGRDADKLARAAGALGGGVRAVRADVGDRAAMANVLDGAARVDHVFVAAGGVTLGRVVDGDLAAFERGVDERIWGNVNALRAAVPKMARGGSVTLTSGVRSERPAPGSAMTTALVAAVEGLTRALSVELAPAGVRVNAVAPGWVDTPLVRGLLGDAYDAVAAAEGARIPAGRFGAPREVAEAVLFLMTNGYVTGEVMHVDGGLRWA
jgi:NAD(P)-dependent dehydrogenase (short-subunit alcohol dehydrogenase family)